MPIKLRLKLAAAAGAFFAFASLAAQAASPPELNVTFNGDAQPLFNPASQACDGNDVPDVNARAFKTATGDMAVYALHDLNRVLRGPDLAHLRIDCGIPFQAHHNPDPAAYDDNAWITAVWTRNGVDVSALVHHEYHANEHPGRCQTNDAMACWYNTILEINSTDGGRTFLQSRAPYVASAPFRQEQDQTRHRGFFNPSNIVEFQGAQYFFASTTGWSGQPYGACLFRSRSPEVPSSWRAYDGSSFSIHYTDPYGPGPQSPQPCMIVAPFGSPVGSVTRYRNGTFLAVWQAKQNAASFPVSGFYYATSRDLLRWSDPRLLMQGPTLYDDACASGGQLINYPSVLDDRSSSRNFETIGDRPSLLYARLRVSGCQVTSDRVLLRRTLVIAGGRAQ